MKKALAVIAVFIILIGCGSSGSESSKGLSNITYESDVVSTNLTDDDYLEVSFSCTGKEVFEGECKIKSVLISFPEEANNYVEEQPINIKMKQGDEKKYTMKLVDKSLKNIGAFTYLHAVNPSNADTGWTIIKEILTEPGAEVTDTAICIHNVDNDEYNCTQVIENYLPGTLHIEAGGKVLDETKFGVLSGDGSGTVSNVEGVYEIRFKVTGINEGDDIIFSYQTCGEKCRKNGVYLTDGDVSGAMKITYGDLVLRKSGTKIIDDNGNEYGKYVTDESEYVDGIEFTKPLGYKNTMIYCEYESYPYNILGGEILGYGSDKKEYKFKFKPYMTEISVFSTFGEGTVKKYDPETGDLEVKFDEEVKTGEPIYISYMVTKVRIPIDLIFKTNSGNIKGTVNYTLKRGR
jgi:hypothetical protein